MLTFKRSFLQFQNGERVVAPVAAPILSILILATLFSMWWAGTTERVNLRDHQSSQMIALSTTLKDAIAPLIEQNDLAPLRRLVVQTTSAFHLTEFRITLPDGRIIADGSPGRIRVQTLPPHWTGPLDGEPSVAAPDTTVSQFPVIIPNRGTVIVYLLATVNYPTWARSDMQGGLSLIGIAGISFILMFYRHLRFRVASLGMIREALMLSGQANQNPDILRIDSRFGPEATTWNSLIDNHYKLRSELAGRQTGELLGNRSAAAPELETACDTLAEGFIVLGSDGKPRYANGAAAAFLGCDRETLVGASISGRLPSLPLKTAIENAISGADKQRRHLEIENKFADGFTVFRFDIHPVRSNGLEEVLITIHDITQQRIADTSRNAFVAHITHELRTPLTTIGLYLDTAASDGEKDPVIRSKCLNVITQESKRLERIVSEMLSVSEIEAGSMQLNLDDLRLDALFEGFRVEYQAPAEKKNVQLLFDLPPKFPVLRADRERISIAIHNLLGNAIKYTPAGGSVKVTLKTEASQIRLEVTDTGIGIDEKEQDQIFNRFYRSKDPRVGKIVGTGLGLTISREIARLHGGDVTLQSHINKGSTFILTLPLSAERS